jgi:hypothetical protein
VSTRPGLARLPIAARPVDGTFLDRRIGVAENITSATAVAPFLANSDEHQSFGEAWCIPLDQIQIGSAWRASTEELNLDLRQATLQLLGRQALDCETEAQSRQRVALIDAVGAMSRVCN